MKRVILSLLVGLAVLALPLRLHAQRTTAATKLNEPAEWYKSEDAAKMAANILSYQSELGGWPSNTDTAAKPYDGDRSKLASTFDNSATTDELRFLARMFVATGDTKYRAAFDKGLDYILKARYSVGGWPQSYPPSPTGYNRYITFNDGTTVRLMFFCKEIATEDRYSFVDSDRRRQCRDAWDRGIEVILKCQIKVDGKLTAWCAQHDEKDFSPKPARAFEPVSLSGCETIGIVHALMAVEKPAPQIIAAVDGAYEWLNAVKIPGIKTEDRPTEGAPRGIDRFVVEDPSAPPMWARFYEIGTNKPIFGDRDGKVYYKLSDISIERRTGYQWLKYWPKNFVEKEYPEWKAKVSGAK
jgi:PelA/Pel-15E family pectate lyase